ncbi:hypothetical protein F2981_11145 [Sinorhizobium meliloti]|nr:hypothetical protein [Sinorhizobium meliloti]
MVLEKGRRSGRAYPLRRRVDPDRHRRALARLARRTATTVQDEVTDDQFLFLGPPARSAFPIPDAALMNNHGKLRRLPRQCLSLARHPAEGSASKSIRLCRDRGPLQYEGAVIGVATATWHRAQRRAGRTSPRHGAARQYTLIGEGVRGSLAKQLTARYSSTRGGRAEIRHRPKGTLGGEAGKSLGPASCSIPSVGRSA